MIQIVRTKETKNANVVKTIKEIEVDAEVEVVIEVVAAIVDEEVWMIAEEGAMEIVAEVETEVLNVRRILGGEMKADIRTIGK